MSLPEVDNDRNLEINAGADVKDFLATYGGQKFLNDIEEALTIPRFARMNSHDPHLVVSCVKFEDGILHVKALLDSLIEIGEHAAQDPTKSDNT
jgi:hypothetical protein